MSLTPKLMYVYFSHYVFFTFSNISKTLILCSIKQKPRTWCNKFTASSMRNTDNEGDRFGFCFDSDQCDQRFPSLTLLLLIRCKAKIHSLIWTVREFILSFPSKQSWSWIIWNDQHQGVCKIRLTWGWHYTTVGPWETMNDTQISFWTTLWWKETYNSKQQIQFKPHFSFVLREV